MTHEEFNRLYDNGEIVVKIWAGTFEDGTKKSIEAFEHCGKFYLRIHSVLPYVLDRTAECGKRYRMTKESHFIKEFDNKNHANAYFKKAAQGLNRVI